MVMHLWPELHYVESRSQSVLSLKPHKYIRCGGKKGKYCVSSLQYKGCEWPGSVALYCESCDSGERKTSANPLTWLSVRSVIGILDNCNARNILSSDVGSVCW